MKPPRILIISLGLNLLLAATLLAVRKNHSTPPPASNVPAPQVSVAAADPSSLATNSPAVAASLPFSWRMIESADYRQYLTNLRAAGCPERLIRDIIVADIEKLYARKVGKMESTPMVFDPWVGADRRQAAGRAREAARLDLDAEKRALIKELLGYEWDSQSNELWRREGMFGVLLGFLSDEQGPQILALSEKYTGLAERVKREAENILIDEDKARLREISDNMTADISRLISPAAFDELDMRVQLFGFMFGKEIHLEGVTISGAEAREVMRYSKSIKDVLRDEIIGDKSVSAEEEDRRKAVFEKQLAQLLGPARYADYQRAQDGNFRTAFDFTQEHNLPKTGAIKVHDALSAAQEQVNQIKQDKSLSRDERAAALEVLKAVTANTLSSALGASYPEYIKENSSALKDLVLLPSQTKGQP